MKRQFWNRNPLWFQKAAAVWLGGTTRMWVPSIAPMASLKYSQGSEICCVEWRWGKYSDHFLETSVKNVNWVQPLCIARSTTIWYHLIAGIAPQCASQEDLWRICRGRLWAVLLMKQTSSWCGHNLSESIWGSWRFLHAFQAHCRCAPGDLSATPGSNLYQKGWRCDTARVLCEWGGMQLLLHCSWRKGWCWGVAPYTGWKHCQIDNTRWEFCRPVISWCQVDGRCCW